MYTPSHNNQLRESVMPNGWGRRVRTLMQQRGWTASYVAEQLGVSTSAVAKWVAGGDISEELLRNLGKLFDVSWLWLRYGREALQPTEGLSEQASTEMAQKRIKELVAHDERCALALCAAGYGVYDYNILTDEAWLDYRAAEMLGLLTEEQEDQPGPFTAGLADFMGRVVEEDRNKVNASYEEMAEGRITRDEWRYRIQTPEGEVRSILGYALLARDALGRPYRIVGLLRWLNTESKQ